MVRVATTTTNPRAVVPLARTATELAGSKRKSRPNAARQTRQNALKRSSLWMDIRGEPTVSTQPYWTDGKRTIYHGDCRLILPTLPRCDLVLTDPPYGMGDRMNGGTWGGSKKYDKMREWDKVADQQIADLILEYPKIIMWGGNFFKVPPSRCWLIWEKSNAVPTMADFEMAWTNFDRPGKKYKGQVGIHHHGHPTEKPLDLFKWCLLLAGDIKTVLDPCLGSGTTLRACKDLGLSCIGIELEEEYCEISARRLEQECFEFEGMNA